MKKLFFFLAVAAGSLAVHAQSNVRIAPDSTKKPRHFAQDALLSHWVVDINLLGGGVSQSYSGYNSINNYNSAIGSVSNTGKLSFSNGLAYGFDAQLGYFFGKMNNFGIGLGFMLMGEQGTTQLDAFHVEYKNYDNNGDVFRQLITADGPVKETLHLTDMSIPVLFKFKHRLSERWGIYGDAGALINLQLSTTYSSNARFDYEAVYQKSGSGDDPSTYSYDNGATPAANDVLYTKAQYVRVNPGQDENTYFNVTLPGKGYNTGLNVTPANTKGSVTYMTGSVGFLIQPGVNYYISNNFALNLGLYYYYQPFTNTSSNQSQMLTNKVGDYNSILFTAKNGTNQSYGLNLGVRIYLGKFVPLDIASEDGSAPTYCGICDGTISLNGLFPHKAVVVNYRKDTVPQPAYKGTVGADGTVRLTGLCKGNYSDITATVGKQTANGVDVSLDNPPARISSESSVNPSANGACDGSITLYGMHAGQSVKVSYNLDGSDQPTFTGTVAPDNTLTMSRLCAGTYSGIVATTGSCSANGKSVTLTAPPPPPAPVAAAPADDLSKISKPILFEVNRTLVHKSSYVTLVEAAHKLDNDPNSYIIVDGYTDATGKKAHNKVLSLNRAEAVKSLLVNMGIDPKRIKVVGHADSDPVAPNDNAEHKLENRRAVMHLNVGE